MVRILVCGDPALDLAYASTKLAALCAKSGPFEFLLLTHPPLPESPTATLPGSLRFPIPTFYAAQYSSRDDAAALAAANLTCVGPAAALSLHGLSVVLLASGYDDPPPTAYDGALPPEITAAFQEAGVHGAGFRGVDIFVCPTLPRGIVLASASAAATADDDGSQKQQPSSSTLVAHIARKLRPRYHFGATTKFAALAPFVIHAALHSTRFLALAHVTRGKGERWLFAADVSPLRHMSATELAATRTMPELSAPYDDGQQVQLRQQGSRGSVVRGQNDGADIRIRHGKRQLHKKNADREGVLCPGKRPRSSDAQSVVQTPADANCWFCLGNEKDPHLVLSVGEHFYLAAAKGGIVPEHFLIVPILHLRNSVDPALTTAMREEVSKLKRSVSVFYKDTLEGATPYFFERAVRTRGGESQMHMHIHCIPIKAGVVNNATMNALVVANTFNIKLQVVRDGQDCSSALCEILGARTSDCSSNLFDDFEFFWAELPDGNNFVQVVSAFSGATDNVENGDSPIDCSGTKAENADNNASTVAFQDTRLDDTCDNVEKKNSIVKKCVPRHPLHFGRKIAAEVLDLPMRVDWKMCVGAIREEERTARLLREAFAPFAPDD